MDKKSKILIEVFCILMIASFIASYYRTMIIRDFPVENRPEETLK